MKSVDSRIYNKDYYLHSCLGFEEYKKFKGNKAHARVENFLSLIKILPNMQALDIGCGRGDLSIECAKRGAKVIGIDYSKDGVDIAKNSLKFLKLDIRKNVSFYRMDAKKLKFTDNSFDLITSYDVFEHLYKEELEMTMKEIYRVLKPNGILLIHTETNKIYLNFTHHIWAYPIDKLLVKINKLVTKKEYPGLPKNPRNELHKIQHVNEPTYFYLNSLFKRHHFSGEIHAIIPMKPILSWKDNIHNILVSLHPFSSIFPLQLLFAHDYICIMKKIKSIP